MANIKTAISIEKPLFEQVDNLSHELKISRSRLFLLAAREFVNHHKNQKLLAAINEAQDDSPGTEEEKTLQKMRFRHFELVKDQW